MKKATGIAIETDEELEKNADRARSFEGAETDKLVSMLSAPTEMRHKVLVCKGDQHRLKIKNSS